MSAPLPDRLAAVPTLPPDALLEYLAEGAANIIYRISFPPTSSPSSPSSSSSSFSSTSNNNNTSPFSPPRSASAETSEPPPTAPAKNAAPAPAPAPATNGARPGHASPDRAAYANRLLRLRKALPSAAPNLTAYRFLSTTAFPLFPSHLVVRTTLLRIPRRVLADCNARLREAEALGRRRAKRAGLYLEESEEFAFLMDDMSPRPGETLVEFKPKWLVQSPSAPPAARRCRTCALRASLGAKGGFCPLDLASGEEARVRRAVEAILAGANGHAHQREGRPAAPSANSTSSSSTASSAAAPPAKAKHQNQHALTHAQLVAKITTFLTTSELLPVLKTLQKRLDPDGPLNTDFGNEFLSAMTIRDTTVFLTVGESAVQARVADLDMKSPDNGKGEYWRETERVLVEEGWYAGRGLAEGEGCGV